MILKAKHDSMTVVFVINNKFMDNKTIVRIFEPFHRFVRLLTDRSSSCFKFAKKQINTIEI